MPAGNAGMRAVHASVGREGALLARRVMARLVRQTFWQEACRMLPHSVTLNQGLWWFGRATHGSSPPHPLVVQRPQRAPRPGAGLVQDAVRPGRHALHVVLLGLRVGDQLEGGQEVDGLLVVALRVVRGWVEGVGWGGLGSRALQGCRCSITKATKAEDTPAKTTRTTRLTPWALNVPGAPAPLEPCARPSPTQHGLPHCIGPPGGKGAQPTPRPCSHSQEATPAKANPANMGGSPCSHAQEANPAKANPASTGSHPCSHAQEADPAKANPANMGGSPCSHAQEADPAKANPASTGSHPCSYTHVATPVATHRRQPQAPP